MRKICEKRIQKAVHENELIFIGKDELIRANILLYSI